MLFDLCNKLIFAPYRLSFLWRSSLYCASDLTDTAVIGELSACYLWLTAARRIFVFCVIVSTDSSTSAVRNRMLDK